MKTDSEIKDWIDSREALTQNELQNFIYGYETGRKHNTFWRWWLYVIDTKDSKALNKHITFKRVMGSFDVDRYTKVKDIHSKDIRVSSAGCHTAIKLLKKFYNINIGKATLLSYRNKIKNNYELV